LRWEMLCLLAFELLVTPSGLKLKPKPITQPQNPPKFISQKWVILQNTLQNFTFVYLVFT
jgi:hypothetical protein